MLTPQYIQALSDGAVELAGELESAVIAQVIRRLLARMKDEDEIRLSPTDVYQLRTLKDAGILMQNVVQTIARITGLQAQEIAQAFADAGVEAIKWDNEIYQRADLYPVALDQSPHLVRLLQRNYEATMGLWDNYTRTTADTVQQSFIRECSRTYNAVASTAVPYNTAIMDAVRRLLEQDVESVAYTHPDGSVHHDTIEVATFRAVRTGVNQACAQITAQTANDHGITLFGVSSHVGARPAHALWQGGVYWVDWPELSRRTGVSYDTNNEATDEQKGRYREFCRATDIGTVTGLCGANCRHSYYPFIEGLDYSPFPPVDPAENKKAYDISQRQRAMERAIRKTKRRVQGYTVAVETAPNDELKNQFEKSLQRALKLLTKQNLNYRAFCEENDLKPQELRLYVG